MASHRFRRKYQTGGVIPSTSPNFQGFQTLAQPQPISQGVRPIQYDPSGAFGALQARDRSLNSAIQQANVQRLERRDAQEVEMSKRKLLTDELNSYYERAKTARDEVTALDYNSPEQFALAQQMHRQLDEINESSTAILVDESLSPQERGTRLQEKYLQANKLMSQPDYIKYMKKNVVADKVLESAIETVGSGESIIDYNILNKNMEYRDKFLSGEITEGQLFSNIKPFTIDKKYAHNKIQTSLKYITDSMDKKKAPILHEQYVGDPDFLTYHGYMNIDSKEDQLDAIMSDFTSDQNFIKAMEASGNGSFLDDKGYFSEEKFRNYMSGNLDLIRGGLGDDAIKALVEVETTKRTAGKDSLDSKTRVLVNDLEKLGYDTLLPSTLSGFTSATDVIELLGATEESLEAKGLTESEIAQELALQQQLQQALRFRGQGGESGEDAASTGEVSTASGFTFPAYQDLPTGEVGDVIPDKGNLDRNLGYYTNNPLNIKVTKDKPHTTKYDYGGKEGTTVAQGVYPDIRTGTQANMKRLGDWQDGNSKIFNEHLTKRGKTIEDATIGDLYSLWSTSSTKEKVKNIAEAAGVTPQTKLQDIETEDLFKGMMKQENPEMYEDFYNSPQQGTTEGSPEVSAPTVKNMSSGYIVDQGNIKLYKDDKGNISSGEGATNSFKPTKSNAVKIIKNQEKKRLESVGAFDTLPSNNSSGDYDSMLMDIGENPDSYKGVISDKAVDYLSKRYAEMGRLTALRELYLSGDKSDPLNQKEGLRVSIEKLKNEILNYDKMNLKEIAKDYMASSSAISIADNLNFDDSESNKKEPLTTPSGKPVSNNANTDSGTGLGFFDN